MTVEEFKDFYTEGSFSVRDTEIRFKLMIAQELADIARDEEELKLYAKAIHKHVSFLKECIGAAQHWVSIEGQYTKEKSWRDLVKLAGIETEKRPRKSLKKIIEERARGYKMKLIVGKLDPYFRGKYDEDMELLKNDEKKED